MGRPFTPHIVTEESASSAQVVDGSLRFNSGSSHYLNRTPSTTGNRRTWTWSSWVKFTNIDKNDQVLFSAVSGSSYIHFRFMGVDSTNARSHKLNVQLYDGSTSWNVYTRRALRDSGSWYHLLLQVDYTQVTAADRTKIYINGELTDQVGVSNSDSASFAAQDYETFANLSGAVNNIGYHSSYGEYFDGELSNVYLIDGLALEPTEFGFTDPLTNTWRPKKYTGNVNYVVPGQVDYESGFDSQPLDAGSSWLPFYGNTSNNGYSQSKNTTLTYTAPGSGIAYTSTIRLFCKTGSGGTNSITIDGNTFTPSTGSGNNTGAWNDISSYVTGGVLNTIVTSRGSGGRNTYWSAIEVDGVILTHIQQGVNGFYLPFDGNTPIGKDQSGNGNDFTPVNFGGYNSIEKATGALPILNTVNGGTTATATVREDANASNLIFALPLAGDITEVTQRINNARTALSFTDSGSTDTVVRHFYGGSRNFDGSNDFLKASIPDGDGLHLQQSSWTVECWFRADVLPGGNDVYLGGVRVDTSTNANNCWSLRIFNNVIEALWVTGGTQYKTVSPYAITATKWTHVAWVRDGNEQRLYQDGVLVVTSSHTTTPNLNNSSFLEIGGRTGSGFFNGKIQDFRIYNNLAKYTGDFIPAAFVPDIRPDTPSGVAYGSELKQITEGSVNGGVSNGDTLLIGNSSDFNFGSGDFTVELFAYHTSTAGNDTLLGIWNSGANKRSWMIDIEADQGRLRGYWSTAGSNNSSVQTATNYIARRRWNHIVFCRQGNTMRLYLNGNQEATATESGSLYNNTDDSLGILSATDAGNDPCRGHISNVRIIKGTCLYPDGTSFTPPSAPLTNVTNTVLLGCQSPTNPAEFQVGAAGTTYTTEGSVSPSAYSNQLWRLFDNNNGTFWGHTSQNSNSGYVTYTFPGSGIPFTQLEIAGSNYNSLSVKVNGVEFTNWGTSYQSPPWHDITSSVTSPLTSVSVYGNGSGQTSTMSRIRINGSILVDAVTVRESVSASTFNPFTDDINTVRGQENAYCTLNAAATYNGDDADIQDGGLKFECPASGDASARGTIPIPAGSKFYMEARYRAVVGSGGQARLGITQVQQGYTKSGTGMWSIDFRGSAGTIQKDDEGTVTTLTGNPDQNDIVGIKIDLATGEFRAHHRGIYYNGGNALMTGIPNVESYFFAALDGGPNRNDWDDINFGQKPWEYPPGDGYEPLCSANLPKPTSPAAVRPDKYFKTVLWTGDDSTDRSITTGFGADFVWVKARNQAYSHHLYDSVRGPSLRLLANGTQSEFDQTSTDGVSSFNSDGFDVSHTNSDAVNQLNTTYVGWSWKAGGSSGTFNIDGRGYATAAEAGLNGGTITPTGASVNTESGFSIITYTGDGSTSSGVTINHGLGDTPAFIITKKRSSGTTDYGWSCWHKNIGGNYGIWLHSGNARNASMWDGYTNISSTVFSPPDLNYGNENGQTYVNYLWSEVPGYSKFGTYTGNGDASGPLVECGFKPALIITKQLNGGNTWFMIDTTREPTNPAGDKWFLASSSGSEVTNNNKDLDILSNGFKPRLVTGYHNDNNVPYLYMAWAEVPTFNLYGGQSNAR